MLPGECSSRREYRSLGWRAFVSLFKPSWRVLSLWRLARVRLGPVMFKIFRVYPRQTCLVSSSFVQFLYVCFSEGGRRDGRCTPGEGHFDRGLRPRALYKG